MEKTRKNSTLDRDVMIKLLETSERQIELGFIF